MTRALSAPTPPASKKKFTRHVSLATCPATPPRCRRSCNVKLKPEPYVPDVCLGSPRPGVRHTDSPVSDPQMNQDTQASNHLEPHNVSKRFPSAQQKRRKRTRVVVCCSFSIFYLFQSTSNQISAEVSARGRCHVACHGAQQNAMHHACSQSAPQSHALLMSSSSNSTESLVFY